MQYCDKSISVIVAHFYLSLPFLCFRDMMSVRNLNFLFVSSIEPGMKSETSGVIWHVDPESTIQLVNCELSPKFLLRHSSLTDICAIDAYIFWSLIFLSLLHSWLRFSIKHTCFCCFSLSFGGFGYFAIRWSSDPHLKHFWGVRSVHLLSELPAAQAFSCSFLIHLKHFL